MPRQMKKTSARPRVPQQIDLFAEAQTVFDIMPVWSGLPAETQASLACLMTRLILDHTDKSRIGATPEVGLIYDKVHPHHLERKALLYVRQLSAHQILHNRESSALQYAMRVV